MNYYDILLAKKLAENEGGGGSSVEVEPLSVTENGTYEEEGKAFSPVTVNVGNTFSNKTLTVTYVNQVLRSVTNSEKNVFIYNGRVFLEFIVVPEDSTSTYTYLQMPTFNEFHVEVLHYADSSQTPVPTISDAVNCTLEHSSTPISGHFVYEIVVTDTTKDASCTITLGGLA